MHQVPHSCLHPVTYMSSPRMDLCFVHKFLWDLMELSEATLLTVLESEGLQPLLSPELPSDYFAHCCFFNFIRNPNKFFIRLNYSALLSEHCV